MSQPWTIHHANNLDALRAMPDGSVDSVVSDPPYGLSEHSSEDIVVALTAWLKGDSYEHSKGGFMGKGWDSFVPGPHLWKECYRVLKPGGHLLAFSGTRTQDLMGMSLRLAGFEIRDGIAWIHGQGFPKSHNVSKALDKVAGTEFSARPAEGVGFMRPDGRGGYNVTRNRLDRVGESSDDAKEWDGWGTALKPAFEPVIICRKPIESTIAANVLAHGTGAMNIDDCRIAWGKDDPTAEEWEESRNRATGEVEDVDLSNTHLNRLARGRREAAIAGELKRAGGRWPSNVILGHADECVQTSNGWRCVPDCPAYMLDEQSGDLRPRGNVNKSTGGGGMFGLPVKANQHHTRPELQVGGGASRFFYSAKASKGEKTAKGDVKNEHPTVKPIALMRYLCRLVTPPGGIVLDPFMGSGSTGVAAILEKFQFVGMELDRDSYETAEARLRRALQPGVRWDDPVEEIVPEVLTSLEDLLGQG